MIAAQHPPNSQSHIDTRHTPRKHTHSRTLSYTLLHHNHAHSYTHSSSHGCMHTTLFHRQTRSDTQLKQTLAHITHSCYGHMFSHCHTPSLIILPGTHTNHYTLKHRHRRVGTFPHTPAHSPIDECIFPSTPSSIPNCPSKQLPS